MANSDSYFNEASGSRPNATDGGAILGTESIWFKISQSGSMIEPMLWVASNGTNTINHGAFVNFSNNALTWYSKNNANDGRAYFTASSPVWDDGGAAWHQLTVTYSLAVNGGSTAQIYLDGDPLTMTEIDDTFTTTTNIGNFNEWAVSRDLAGTVDGSQGSMDDFAVWGTQLTATQSKALYNLGLTGIAGTNYNAKDVTALFNGFSSSTGAVTSDGRSWTFVASGLAGTAGTVGDNYVVLDGSGGGMILTPVDVTWTGGGSSTWSTATSSGNWKKTSDGTTADYGNDVNVMFNDTATTLTADISAADVTPTSVTFDNSTANYTVTGTKGIAGPTTTVTKQGTGKVTLASVNTYGGLTTVEDGTLQLSGFAKAQVPVLSGAGVDLKGGTLVLDYTGETSQMAMVVDLLTASYDAESSTHFDTGQFQSSTADDAHGLGWAYNSTAGQVIVAYTLYGDANLDGKVNLSDLGILGDNYGRTGMTWQEGDFNYDGVVNLSDLGYLGDNYGRALTDLSPTGPLGDPSLDTSASSVAGDPQGVVAPTGVVGLVPAAVAGDDKTVTPSPSIQPTAPQVQVRENGSLRTLHNVRAALVDRLDLGAVAAYELTHRAGVESLLSALDEDSQPVGRQIAAFLADQPSVKPVEQFAHAAHGRELFSAGMRSLAAR